MSNNPFLKSKESNNKKSNNRFNFLDDEDTDNKSSFKESSNKSNRKHIEYDASQNSFTQKTRVQDRPRDRDRDSYRPNNTKNNDYKPRQREPSPPPVIVDLDANNTNLFPDLAPPKENKKNITTTIEPLTKFKDILTNIIEEEKPKENTIPPGWVQLSSVNGKTLIEYGPKTAWMIRQEKLEELEKQQEDDPNYIMFKAVEAMKKSWYLFEREYDAINGEGAYAERFRLPPVYGPEYDTEEEVESSDDDNEV
jgi:hypothetical protein